MSGIKKAISYSLKPHELGYCGPQELNSQIILRDYLLGKKYSKKLILNLLKQFTGSYCYYNLIAKSNNIKNWHDEKVIEAYWLGNNLLENIRKADLEKMILQDFTGDDLLAKNQALKIIKNLPEHPLPHHSFHVFFIGSITGRVKLNKAKKELCKVLAGEIINLNKKNKKIILKNNLSLDWDLALLPKIKIGDLITAHWGRAIEKINQKQFNNLKKYSYG